ncbi:unnamed protein product [Cylindrotheca closterium]|uniref:Uncharacterized protein n=1 Tax=Cylindrotheca closterium TaxID=2856 RepID=A0AAD2G577_9STRA|nr:unnamed protein product [Cylindrotheca closterium]
MAIFAASSINSVAVIWGYSAGGTVSNMDDDDEDLSERFTMMRVPAANCETKQQQVETVVPEHHSTADAIWSCAVGNADDEELSERFEFMRAPTPIDETIPLPAAIDEHWESSSDDSSESPPSLLVGHSRTDEVQIAPSTTIRKLLPFKIKLQDELSKTYHTPRQFKKPTRCLSPVRQAVYNMDRSDCRSRLESSFCQLDSARHLPSIKKPKRSLSDHTSAPCFGSSLERSTKSEEFLLMARMREEDLRSNKSLYKKKPKTEKSKSGSSKGSSLSSKRSYKKCLRVDGKHAMESPVSPKRSSTKKSLSRCDSLSPKRSSKKSLKADDKHTVESPISPKRSSKKNLSRSGSRSPKQSSKKSLKADKRAIESPVSPKRSSKESMSPSACLSPKRSAKGGKSLGCVPGQVGQTQELKAGDVTLIWRLRKAKTSCEENRARRARLQDK